MFQCPVCQSNDYVLDVEQMQCCAGCGFLTQEYLGEIVDAGCTATKVKRIYRSIQTIEDKEKKKKKKGQVPEKPERPWYSDEGFQHIMKEQVKAMIENLNGNEMLKDTLFRLWVHYLRKSGRAFVGRTLPLSERRKLKGIFRYRDKYPGTVEDPKIYGQVQALNTLKSLDKRDDLDEAVKRRLKIRLKDQLAHSREERERYRNGRGLRDADRRAVETMTLLKTLCFLHLSLQVWVSNVDIYDIVRWVRQERLPYLRLSNWPSDMKFYVTDEFVFVPKRAPTAEELFREERKLCMFLDLNDCFGPVDLRVTAKKVIRDLCLPEEFYQYVDNVMDRHDPDRFIKNPHHMNLEPACVATCYVVYTLKLFLALDGRKEKRMSRLADWLTKRMKLEKPLFNFMDWLRYVHGVYDRSVEHDLQVTSGKIHGIQSNIHTCKTTKRKDSLWNEKRIAYLKEWDKILQKVNQDLKSNAKYRKRMEDPFESGSDDDGDGSNSEGDLDDDGREEHQTRLGYNRDWKSMERKIESSPFREATLRFFLDGKFLGLSEEEERAISIDYWAGVCDDDGYNVGQKAAQLRENLRELFECKTTKEEEEERSSGDDDDGGAIEGESSSEDLLDRPESKSTEDKKVMAAGDDERGTPEGETCEVKAADSNDAIEETDCATVTWRDVPEDLRPNYFPMYPRYPRRTMRKQRLLDKYCEMNCRDVPRRGVSWQDQNEGKSWGYMDVVEVCSRLLCVRPQYLEAKLHLLERYIFDKVEMLDPYEEEEEEEGREEEGEEENKGEEPKSAVKAKAKRKFPGIGAKALKSVRTKRKPKGDDPSTPGGASGRPRKRPRLDFL